MGQLLAMLAREVWKINVVGTTQTNRCGPDGALVKKAKTALKVRSYESIFFYHKFKPLCVALWGDNNIVTTLSNHHPPRLLRAGTGVHRRLLGDDGFPLIAKIRIWLNRYLDADIGMLTTSIHTSSTTTSIRISASQYTIFCFSR